MTIGAPRALALAEMEIIASVCATNAYSRRPLRHHKSKP
jgi:hypothetical protein